MRARPINPTHLSEEDALLLGSYLVDNEIVFLERSRAYSAETDFIQSQYHLILDQDYKHANTKRYQVISSDKKDVLGSGASSKARIVLGHLDVDLINKKAHFSPSQEKAIRIKNTKQTQLKHVRQDTRYSHKQAKKEYDIGSQFDHLGMQPVKVKKDRGHAGLGLFTKSYSVMNRFKGKNLKDSVEEFIGNDRPSTIMMIEKVILPILEAYKHQIADKGWVHRDIKPENIRADIGLNRESTINFLDMDGCLKPGEEDAIYGSAGYFAPELAERGIPVRQARDIFALGVLLIGCINPELNPLTYFGEERHAMSAGDLTAMALYQVNANGCYDPDKMEDTEGYSFELFENMADMVIIPDEQNEIKSLLKKMTAKDPNDRPDLDTVITAIKSVLAKLNQTPSPNNSTPLIP